MIDTTIEIRSTDIDWFIKSLEYLASDLKEQQKQGFDLKTFTYNRAKSGHNYDVMYSIKKVKEIA